EYTGLGSGLIAAAPDMGILIRIASPIPFHLFPENLREPRIFGPVGLYHHRIGRLVGAAQELVNRIGWPIRIPAKPQFRVRLADGGPQQINATLAQSLSFLNPGNIKTLEG